MTSGGVMTAMEDKPRSFAASARTAFALQRQIAPAEKCPVLGKLCSRNRPSQCLMVEVSIAPVAHAQLVAIARLPYRPGLNYSLPLPPLDRFPEQARGVGNVFAQIFRLCAHRLGQSCGIFPSFLLES